VPTFYLFPHGSL
jgi:uncharacterized protein